MKRVEITDGLKYGFQIMGYYLGVALAGSLMSAFGVFIILFEVVSEFGAAAEGAADPDPSVALLLFGLFITIVGVLIVWAGLFGSLYKIVADAVAKGEYLAELTEHDPVAEAGAAADSTAASDTDASKSTAATDTTTSDTAASDADTDANDADGGDTDNAADTADDKSKETDSS